MRDRVVISERWVSGYAGRSFRISPQKRRDGTLVFNDTRFYGLIWYFILAVPTAIFVFMIFDLKMWKGGAFGALWMVGTIALCVFTLYRGLRIATRRNRLVIDPNTRTASLEENWPRRQRAQVSLEDLQLVACTMTASGYRGGWSGSALIAFAGDAWFVIAAYKMLPQDAAFQLPPNELRELGLVAVHDEAVAIETFVPW